VINIKNRELILSRVKFIDECWIWQKGLFPSGYGQVSISGQTLSAHRVSYEIFKGPISKGKMILHTLDCENRNCVNPDHLYEGDHLRNMMDMVSTGARRGENNSRAKLTTEEVVLIKQKIRDNNYLGLLTDLAYQFKVSLGAIKGIKQGRRWTHVKI